MLRFANNKDICTEYEIDQSLIRSSLDYQEKVFYQLFPEKVDTGRNPKTIDWLIGRVKDSLG